MTSASNEQPLLKLGRTREAVVSDAFRQRRSHKLSLNVPSGNGLALSYGLAPKGYRGSRSVEPLSLAPREAGHAHHLRGPVGWARAPQKSETYRRARVWIDLLNPKREEEAKVERALKIDVPSREEQQETLSRRRAPTS